MNRNPEWGELGGTLCQVKSSVNFLFYCHRFPLLKQMHDPKETEHFSRWRQQKVAKSVPYGLPILNAPVAQLEERDATNVVVVGSSPARSSNY